MLGAVCQHRQHMGRTPGLASSSTGRYSGAVGPICRKILKGRRPAVQDLGPERGGDSTSFAGFSYMRIYIPLEHPIRIGQLGRAINQLAESAGAPGCLQALVDTPISYMTSPAGRHICTTSYLIGIPGPPSEH
jgi:hypothetical protein